MATPSESAVRRMLRTRGTTAAAVTALAVATWMIVVDVLTNLVSIIGIPPEQLAGFSPVWFGYGFLTGVLPFVIGFFLSLWIVGPIAEALGLGHVITRAVLAAGIGATLAFVVRAVANILTSIAFDRPLLSGSFPLVDFGMGIPGLLGEALKAALVLFITMLPVAVLACVLLWHWRKANPPAFHVEGLIDV